MAADYTGICGELEEEGESEIHRLCPAWFSCKQIPTPAASGSTQKAGIIPKRTKRETGPLSHPPDADFPQHFSPLESYAAACGLNEGSHLLKRARVLMIEAHASNPSREADVRDFSYA